MSINSPAKQERIERHLMRQRGAGVRTVSASFGFSFETCAASSSTAVPTTEEPPAKRRRTNLPCTTATFEADVHTSLKAPEALRPSSARSTKIRRRVDLASEVETLPSRAVIGIEDSFVAGLVSKKNLQKKRKPPAELIESDSGGDLVPSEPVIPSRPKRSAAATAAVKVTEGFAEERAPIDKKRRPAEPRHKPSNAALECEVAKENPFDDARRKSDAAPSRRPRKDKQDQHAHGHITRETVGENAQVEIGPPEKKLSANDVACTVEVEETKPRVTRKRKLKPTVKSMSANDEANRTKKLDQPNAPSMVNAEKPLPLQSASQTETSSNHASATDKDSKPPSRSNQRRQPLKEADMNVTKQSTSPKKAANSEEGAQRYFEMKGFSSTQSCKAPECRPNQMDEIARTKSTKTEKNRQSSEKPKVSSRAEDIDWLFESNDSTLPLRKLPKQTKLSGSASSTSAKAVDIDLDDLLSNIASFATSERVGVVENAFVAGRKRAKTTRRQDTGV